MTKRAKRYGSDALAAVHETASDLHAAGLLGKQTMRTFDDLCLTPIEEFTPQQIVDLRLREHASQAVFARYLNVTPSTVSQWERGEKRPRGPSLKLLTLVAKGGLRAIACVGSCHASECGSGGGAKIRCSGRVATRTKDRYVNIRLSSAEVRDIQSLALREGRRRGERASRRIDID